MRAYVPVLGLMLLLPKAINADTLCQNCITTYRAPGAVASVGLSRLEKCPVCSKPNCFEAAEHAKAGRTKYLNLRLVYEQEKARLTRKHKEGMQITKKERDDLEDMRAKLEDMEQHYDALNKKCDKEVVPDNIWDRTKKEGSWPYTGGVGPQPGPPLGTAASSPGAAASPATPEASAAARAAGGYERSSENEQHQMDVIQGFFGARDNGFAPPGYTPPPGGTEGGFNGGRYELTKSFSQVSRGYMQEAQKLTQGGTGKPDPRTDLTKAVVPKFPDIKVARDGEVHVRNAGIAAQSRLECNAYILAFLQARDLHRQSMASGNREAARTHSRSAVEFAFQAKGYAQWAADHQHQADVVHQKLLDQSLAAGAKKGLTVPLLLERFQAKVKEAGLPPHLDAAMTKAGATAEERAEAKARLLALTPDAVEAVLTERRARIAGRAEAPDAALLALQLFTAGETHHNPAKK